ncbi:hypothetical protein [Cohnella abietis]|uniref:Uncharacterized protein n=1 Tax=Cohnella abietis TaxID=2507935 RepID=A0A3T1DFG2_9BACL|nr:hypothetical protein [Cohnella abietis]BBI36625.1 hypothetical protein KCTCHS21_60240 [Cohnella abietis]
MSNEEQPKEIELENLEKPLTEEELKETTGGVGLIDPRSPLPFAPPRAGRNRGAN